jgi:hypothetical protein
MTADKPVTIADSLLPVEAAYEELATRAEDVEDEWTYINDLTAAWRERLHATLGARGDEPVDDATVTALERATDEIARITDPHRAIDWLSTYPQVVLVALGEQP